MDQTDGQHKDAVTISRLTAVDPVVLRQVAELMVVAWGRQATKEDVDRRVAQLEEALRSGDHDLAAMFVAQRDHRVIGFVRVMRDQDHALQWLLFALVVHPAHRRQGIARALTQAAMDYVKGRGAKCIHSDTHTDNIASIRYHERMGFSRGDAIVASDGDHLVPFTMELS